MGYEVRIIVRLLRALLSSRRFSRESLSFLVTAIESNDHILRTDMVEKRLQEGTVHKRTKPVSFEERRLRRAATAAG